MKNDGLLKSEKQLKYAKTKKVLSILGAGAFAVASVATFMLAFSYSDMITKIIGSVVGGVTALGAITSGLIAKRHGDSQKVNYKEAKPVIKMKKVKKYEFVQEYENEKPKKIKYYDYEEVAKDKQSHKVKSWQLKLAGYPLIGVGVLASVAVAGYLGAFKYGMARIETQALANENHTTITEVTTAQERKDMKKDLDFTIFGVSEGIAAAIAGGLSKSNGKKLKKENNEAEGNNNEGYGDEGYEEEY